MASIGTILGTARSAMYAHQIAVQVTSQNVANAETEGYSRQRVDITAGPTTLTRHGALGTGVVVREVARMRDVLLDEGYRREAAGAAGSETRRDLLSRIEGVFGEPSETGLASALDAFWSAWGDLASHPTSAPARGVVQQRGAHVAATLNRFAAQLDGMRESTVGGLRNSLAELNDLLRQVGELNRQVLSTEVGGASAPDLRDARDRLVDRIAKLAPTRTIERADGSVAVYVENVTAVDGSSAKRFTLEGPPYAVKVAGGTDAYPRMGGALGAMLEAVNVEIPDVRAKLDELARALASEVNAVHLRGWTPLETTPPADWTNPDPTLTGSRVPFFDPATTGAADLALSAQVASDPGWVTAGKTQDAPSDNWVALQLSGLRAAPGMVAGESFADFYRGVVTGVALKVSSAEGTAEVHATLAAQADTRRASVSGVSTDEELILLIRHQQAYAAAAKLVSAADEMAQTILNLV